MTFKKEVVENFNRLTVKEAFGSCSRMIIIPWKNHISQSSIIDRYLSMYLLREPVFQQDLAVSLCKYLIYLMIILDVDGS